MSAVARRGVTAMLENAGVRVGGDAPRDVRVRDERFFDRVARDGTLGFGDAYVDGWWECDALDDLFHALSCAPKPVTGGIPRMLHRARYRFMNLQSLARARQVVDAHYDLGNDFFAAWLDPAMQYSCAYWSDAEDLESAQRAKLALVASKLHAAKGDRILEIGCGWGGLAEHLARAHGCSVTALNISDAQIAGARARCAGLDVDVRRCDYRDTKGTWDKVVSVAMLEAVGKRNLRGYMEKVHEVMAPGGYFVLHSIGSDITRLHPDRWITERIFPNGYIPSATELTAAAEGLFAIEDWHNLGPDYDRTLMAWSARFESAWGEIQRRDPRFDERFRRRWRYYLRSCAGTFRARAMQLWQVVFTRHRSGTHWPRVLRR